MSEEFRGMGRAEMIQEAQVEINQNLRRLSRLKLEKKEGRIKRNINWILALWGYHLQKFPHPYTKRKKQPKLPFIDPTMTIKNHIKGQEL
jgi:hypothetical protein